MDGDLRRSEAENAPERLKSLPSLAAGVGQDEYSFALMIGSHGVSPYNLPFRIKPDFGQGPQNVSKSPFKQPCDVFHEDRASKLASKTDGL